MFKEGDPLPDMSTYMLTLRAEHDDAVSEVETAIEELLTTGKANLIDTKDYLESRFKTLRLEADGDYHKVTQYVSMAEWVEAGTY